MGLLRWRPVDRKEIDRVFHALADARRRFVVELLHDHESITLADLADEVVSRERGARLPDVSAEAVRDAYLSLYHRHLPRLEAAEIAEYDQERDVVRWLDTEPSSFALSLLNRADAIAQ